MKKLIAIFLSALLLLCTAVPVTLAAQEDEVYPIIIVPGYSSSSLCKYDENGNQIHVWGVQINDILEAIVKNAAEIGINIGSLAKGDAKKLADTVGREFKGIYYDMAYDAQGKPVTPLTPYYNTAEFTNSAYLNEYEDGKYVHEKDIMPYASEYLGDKADEWTFNFNTDFRQNSEDCAADLNAYIDSVLEYTGAKKVNIVGVSHGCQTTATYLALYGGKKCNTVLLTVPAIGGALLAYDIYSDNIHLDEETLVRFFEDGYSLEEDYNWLVRAQRLGFLDEFFHYFRPHVLDILGTWGSIWDFIPAPYFEEISALASEEFLQSETYQKSVKFHSEIMPNVSQNLKKAENDGAKIYLICGTSLPSVVGSQINSDAIISVNSSSGATTAPFKMRFSDGYEQLGTICSDPSHNHISPDMDIDASTCYLPETTWFVKGLFHGMVAADEKYGRRLILTLINSDEKVTVHSFKEFPQFHESMNVCESVYAEFDNSTAGFVSGEDTALKITNVSNKGKMTILSVSSSNTSLKFKASDYIGKTIEPGQTITVPFSGKLPEKSFTVADIKISYGIELATPLGEKDFHFTVMNGEKPEYDTENPYTSLNKTSSFREHISGSSVLDIFDKIGITPLMEIIYNIIDNFIGKLVRTFVSFK